MFDRNTEAVWKWLFDNTEDKEEWRQKHRAYWEYYHGQRRPLVFEIEFEDKWIDQIKEEVNQVVWSRAFINTIYQIERALKACHYADVIFYGPAKTGKLRIEVVPTESFVQLGGHSKWQRPLEEWIISRLLTTRGNNPSHRVVKDVRFLGRKKSWA